MSRALRIPDETRFVRALALAVDPDDALSLLLEIGALSSPALGRVRLLREALESTYKQASEGQDWQATHTISVLRQALAKPDTVAYVAYHTQNVSSPPSLVEALAVIGCAEDSMSCSRRRPWEIEPGDHALADWREQVRALLCSLPDEAVPEPAGSPNGERATCTCSEPESRAALVGSHAAWCAIRLGEEES